MSEIKRERTSNNFSIVSNVILKDGRISCKLRGLYATVMTLPDDWDFSVRGLAKILPENKDTIYAMMNGLKEFGYVVCERERHNGRLGRTVYTFHEKPVLETPYPKKPDMVKPDPESQTQYNIQESYIQESNNQESSISFGTQEILITRAKSSKDYAKEYLIGRKIEDFENLDTDSDWIEQPSSRPSESEAKGVSSAAVETTVKVPLVAESRTWDGFQQPSLFQTAKNAGKGASGKRLKPKIPVSTNKVEEILRVCYLATSPAEYKLISKNDLARARELVRTFDHLNIDIGLIGRFELWWRNNYRSKNQITKQYQPPTIGQLQSLWLEAMNAVAPLPIANAPKVVAEKPKQLTDEQLANYMWAANPQRKLEEMENNGN